MLLSRFLLGLVVAGGLLGFAFQATLDGPEDLRLADVPSGVALALRKHTRGVTSLAWSSDGKTLASTGWDNTLQLWTINKRQVSPGATFAASASGVAFHPAGNVLCSGGKESVVERWRLQGGKTLALKPVAGHQKRPFVMAFSPDGKLFASGCGDPTLRVWKSGDGDDWEAWGVLANESSPALGIASLAFSHDGSYLAAGHHAGKKTLRIWHVGGAFMEELEFREAQARVVAFSPRESILAFSGDESIRLWDVKDKQAKPRARLAGHPQGKAGAVRALVFTPDGKHLVSAGQDRKVMLWDLATGERNRTWTLPDEPRAVAVHGDLLAVGGDEGVLSFIHYDRP